MLIMITWDNEGFLHSCCILDSCSFLFTHFVFQTIPIPTEKKIGTALAVFGPVFTMVAIATTAFRFQL